MEIYGRRMGRNSKKERKRGRKIRVLKRNTEEKWRRKYGKGRKGKERERVGTVEECGRVKYGRRTGRDTKKGRKRKEGGRVGDI